MKANLQQWFDYLEQLNPNKIDLGLSRVESVYQAFSFDKLAQKTIIVAGTNGKGSTLAYLESILLSCGYSVAKYSSPHLFSFNERIIINGKAVSDDLLLEAFNFVENKRQKTFLSYFEFTTLAAFYCIKQSRVDFALMEIGLGGRLDAVNVLPRDINIITNIELDHQAWLGNSRNQIAMEKLGIAKKNIPLLIGDRNPPEKLRDSMKQSDYPCYLIARDFRINNAKQSYEDAELEWKLTIPPGFSAEQQANLACALKALSLLSAQGVKLNTEIIQKSWQNTSLLGRQSFCRDSKLQYCFDVAHNLAAVKSLSKTLKEKTSKRNIAVFSAMQDKDIFAMINVMSDCIDKWFVSPVSNSRSLSGHELSKVFDSSGMSFQLCETAKQAFQQAQKKALYGDTLVVFGSFFLLAELEKEIKGICCE